MTSGLDGQGSKRLGGGGPAADAGAGAGRGLGGIGWTSRSWSGPGACSRTWRAVASPVFRTWRAVGAGEIEVGVYWWVWQGLRMRCPPPGLRPVRYAYAPPSVE